MSENDIREVDEPTPCNECGTIEAGLYFEDEKQTEWLCEQCYRIKYPNSQRIQ